MFMMKWKIGFYLLWACPIFILPFAQRNSDAAFSIPDEALHFRVRSDGGSWMGAFGRGSSGFPWAIFAFVAVSGSWMNAFRIG